MGISYKTRNVPKLLAVWVFNVVLFLGIIGGSWDFGIGGIPQALRSYTVADFKEKLPFLGLLTLVAVFNGVFPRSVKECLVFWPDGRPGERAFSHFMLKDSTIDKKVLQTHFGPLPSASDEQNALWVTWLHEFDNDARIRSPYELYLFARDWTIIAAAILILATPMAFWFSKATVLSFLYVAILVVQCLLARQVARVQGEQLVKSVMVLKGSSVSVRETIK